MVLTGDRWTARGPEHHQLAHEHALSFFLDLAGRPPSTGGDVLPLHPPDRQLRRRRYRQRRPTQTAWSGVLGKEIADGAGRSAFEEGAHLPECPFLESQTGF